MPAKFLDPLWSEVTKVYEKKNNPVNTCIHCGSKWTSNSPSRIAKHLYKCPKIPERLWSIFGFIHCKRRNRLSNDRVEMLVFIYWNLRILRAVPDLPGSNDGSGGSGGDVDVETVEREEYGEGDEGDLYTLDKD